MRRHQIKVLCDEDPQDFVQVADPLKIEIGRIVRHRVPDLGERSCVIMVLIIGNQDEGDY